jgi:hypothetical protein
MADYLVAEDEQGRTCVIVGVFESVGNAMALVLYEVPGKVRTVPMADLTVVAVTTTFPGMGPDFFRVKAA